MSKKARQTQPGSRESALDARLQLLRNDHSSPSLTLAHEAIDLAEDWLKAGSHPKRLARELLSMHPGLALIVNVARLLEEEDPDVVRSLDRLRESLREGKACIAARLTEQVPPHSTVITLSNSSTVCEALVYLQANGVYVVESRPVSESLQMAERLRDRLALAGQGAAVHLIEANTIGNVVPEVDCAIVGTDTISRSGAVLHKVGTLPLALCCHYFQKPFYAIGHSLKQIDQDFDELPPGNGVLEAQIFDITPRELITQIITERNTGSGDLTA